MSSTRRRHRPEYKFKVALEAAKGTKTIAQLASQFNLHPNQISTWKKQLLTTGSSLFASKQRPSEQAQKHEAHLYEQIGRLQMELEWPEKSDLCS